MPENMSLALCMIVRNEEQNLPLSLGPVHSLFDEVIVIDTGSTDKTVEIAKSYGAKVSGFKWQNDFAEARNASIRAAGSDWIFWLDADNRISPTDVARLRTFLDRNMESILWCTEVVEPIGEELIQKRVFPNRKDVYFEGRVHEQLIHPDSFKSILTPVQIFHWGYVDKELAAEKGNRNLAILEKMVKEAPRDPYLAYQMGKTLFNQRNFQKALNWFDKVVSDPERGRQNMPLFRHAHILKSMVLERLGQKDESESCLLSLVQAFPDYGPVHYYLGRLWYAKGNLDTCLLSFRTFLSLKIKDLAVGFNANQMMFAAALMMGRCLEKAGQPEEALAAYQTAAEINPENPEPVLAMAMLSLEQRQTEDARSHLAFCLKKDPDNRRAIQLLHRMDAHA